MLTYNHPLSYRGPEINETLSPRNEVNAPIHLMLTETPKKSVVKFTYDIALGG